ncbi:hypothetical protein IT893_07375 [Thalassospira sp. A40-3]|uniref:hypothetical protein n=1 Tax=Thalassospira sp. A40-3 TaxID=2785908 RepID=UPI0018CEACC3|nr:hypothetical protein [Thalassospira sp. A40-3]QPO13318.1 hypothetical protein IT893_07375 [Thalassospira sp. A40-3]
MILDFADHVPNHDPAKFPEFSDLNCAWLQNRIARSDINGFGGITKSKNRTADKILKDFVGQFHEPFKMGHEVRHGFARIILPFKLCCCETAPSHRNLIIIGENDLARFNLSLISDCLQTLRKIDGAFNRTHQRVPIAPAKKGP